MLISLALNLMQEQVMNKVHWVAHEIGMSGDGNTNEEVVKLTKEDRLRQTPADMTGNELDFNEKRVEKYGKGGDDDGQDDPNDMFAPDKSDDEDDEPNTEREDV